MHPRRRAAVSVDCAGMIARTRILLTAAALTLSAPAHAATLTPMLDADQCASADGAAWRAFLAPAADRVVRFDAKCDGAGDDSPALQLVPASGDGILAAPENPVHTFRMLEGVPDARGALVAAQSLRNPTEEDPVLAPTGALLAAGWTLALLLTGWGVLRALLR
jgi:hypothetical protein